MQAITVYETLVQDITVYSADAFTATSVLMIVTSNQDNTNGYKCLETMILSLIGISLGSLSFELTWTGTYKVTCSRRYLHS